MIDRADGETAWTRCPLTKADAEAFRRRWELVNEAEREELRNTPLDVKLRQTAALIGFALALKDDTRREREEEAVRVRWSHLRRVWHE